jgi:antitoxin FitA
MPFFQGDIIAIIPAWMNAVANLVVRNLDERIVQALKERATRHKRSAEAEHRALLEQVLLKPRRKTFAQVLASMPDVGVDEDFERIDAEEARRVLD